MNARDELAEILWDNAVADRVRDGKDLKLVPVVRAKAEACADAILAAGYLKPRTITTIEELDALPEWSVIRSEQATIWEKFKGGYGSDFWAETMTLGKHPSSHIALPATVLHEGNTP